MLKADEIARETGSGRARIARRARLMETLAAFPFVLRVIRGVGNRLAGFAAETEAHVGSKAKYLGRANEFVESSDTVGYEGDTEIMCFINYRNQLQNRETRPESEAWVLYDRQLELLTEFFSGPGHDVKGMLNFGVSLAHIDRQLAQRFPDLQFHGIDRSLYTEVLNDLEYGKVPNMTIVTGDIFDRLKTGAYKDFALFHSRTCLMLPRPLIEKLYGAARDAGMTYIFGFEQIGLSRETLEPFDFSYEKRDSVWFRSMMFIHNYPELLRNAGYELIHWECLKTAHPHPDLRVLAFIAKLRDA